jgi:hypothetical protein
MVTKQYLKNLTEKELKTLFTKYNAHFEHTKDKATVHNYKLIVREIKNRNKANKKSTCFNVFLTFVITSLILLLIGVAYLIVIHLQ